MVKFSYIEFLHIFLPYFKKPMDACKSPVVNRRGVIPEYFAAYLASPRIYQETYHHVWSLPGPVNVTVWTLRGGGPRVVVSTAALHARVRGSVPGLGGLKETKMFLPHPRVKFCIVGSLRDREVACSASDRQGSNFESCVWRTVSSQSSHHPQEVLLAQFSLYVHKGGLKSDSFHFWTLRCRYLWQLAGTVNLPYLWSYWPADAAYQALSAVYCHHWSWLRHHFAQWTWVWLPYCSQ